MAGENANQNPDGGDKAAEGFKKEMLEERRKRQEMEAQIKELQQKLEQGGAREEDLEVGEVITDEDLSNLDAKAINAKLAKALAPLQKLEKEIGDLRNRQMSKDEQEKVSNTLAKYEIFHDEDDEELASDARTALEVEMKRLADEGKTSQEDLNQAAASVAKRYTRFKANAAGAGQSGADEVEPVPTGGGNPAAAAHQPPEKPKDDREASEATRKRARDYFKVGGGK